MKLTEAEKIIKKGHPPMAEKIALIDFDGTLFPFGYMFEYPDPLPGAVKAMKLLKSMGFDIYIFTSRLSNKWLKSVGHTKQQHVAYIQEICKRNDIEISGITAEKIPAELYIDDKAIGFRGNWKFTISQILERETAQ